MGELINNIDNEIYKQPRIKFELLACKESLGYGTIESDVIAYLNKLLLEDVNNFIKAMKPYVDKILDIFSGYVCKDIDEDLEVN